MMSQYDAEQLQLENRIAELQEYSDFEPEKADHVRFVTLLKKYRNPEVLTDDMLYDFIDRIEVHAATDAPGATQRYAYFIETRRNIYH